MAAVKHQKEEEDALLCLAIVREMKVTGFNVSFYLFSQFFCNLIPAASGQYVENVLFKLKE